MINLINSKRRKSFNPVNLRRKENFELVSDIINKNYSEKEVNLLEIGAGKTLMETIQRSNIKNLTQYIVDIENQLSYKEIIENLKRYRKDIDTSALTKKNLIEVLKSLNIFFLVSDNLENLFQILPKINIFYSINTLEHIPPEDIKKIIKDFKIISAEDSVSLHLVDFSDHYSSISGVSEWNFYRYSNQFWNYLNPPYFYQNRLRHKDYLEIFSSFGLKAEKNMTRKFYSQFKINRHSLNQNLIKPYTTEDLQNTASRFFLM